MIVAKLGAKTVGVVHIDNHLQFIGYCQGIDGSIAKIDVYLDDKIIDTIVSDKFVQKIDDIYDVGEYSFVYDLDKKYYDKKHIISFKANLDGVELLNSPISTMSKDQEKFYLYYFAYSLSQQNVDALKIDNSKRENKIGIFNVGSHFDDEDMIAFIIKYLQNNSQKKLVIYYLRELEVDRLKKLFSEVISQVEFILPLNLEDIVNSCETYIYNSEYKFPILDKFLEDSKYNILNKNYKSLK